MHVVFYPRIGLSYLQVEWEVRRGVPRRFTPDNMMGSHCRVPLQDNSSDCGLYLLQYVEAFLQVQLPQPSPSTPHLSIGPLTSVPPSAGGSQDLHGEIQN